YPEVAPFRFDPRDVAETGHEGPSDVGDGLNREADSEDLPRQALPGSLFAREVVDPGVLGLVAVEVVAPERLLIAPEPQPALVDLTLGGGDPSVQEIGRRGVL